MSLILDVNGVSKCFVAGGRRPVLGLLRRKFLRGAENGDWFYALRNINFSVAQGERVGIVGNNGAGKTTLIKLLAGLYKPSRGTIAVQGTVTLLTGLGFGMLDELSVRQNVFLYGAIYGLEREIIESELEEIISWAELEDFAEAKLKTLSKGMKTRLAFSTTRHIESDVCLLDEALSAGDRSFREKCDQVFQQYRESGRTFVVSSHNLDFLKNFCEQTVWLHKGRQMAFGETDTVLEQYIQFNAKPSRQPGKFAP